jgi:GDPmannose 4,6-dehydratase
MKSKSALITGITGMDASYLAEFLLEKGYTVYGTMRRSSTFTSERIDHIFNDMILFYSDMTDSSNLNKIIRQVKPDEVYNLAAQSHVQVSFEVPEYTSDVDGLGTLRLLEAVRSENPNCKFYHASTSELFGKVEEIPQNEKTHFNPQSPYAIAKLYAYWIVKNYREAYGLYAVNGILFNHTSPRRGHTFVSKKIVDAVVGIVEGRQNCLLLGNLNAERDWGYAPEYVESMWMMLNKTKTPSDYVIATGEKHTVREFVEEAFGFYGLKIEWEGNGLEEVGRLQKEIVVRQDPKYYRPTEVDLLLGDYSKAYHDFGWKPKTKFKTIVRIMMSEENGKYEGRLE